MDQPLRWSRPRLGRIRGVLAAPVLPLWLLAACLGIAWGWGTPWGLWMVFGAVAGYSLSGST
jgi:hypothetical protein